MPYSQQKIRGFKYTPPSIFRRAKHKKCMSRVFHDTADLNAATEKTIRCGETAVQQCLRCAIWLTTWQRQLPAAQGCLPDQNLRGNGR